MIVVVVLASLDHHRTCTARCRCTYTAQPLLLHCSTTTALAPLRTRSTVATPALLDHHTCSPIAQLDAFAIVPEEVGGLIMNLLEFGKGAEWRTTKVQLIDNGELGSFLIVCEDSDIGDLQAGDEVIWVHDWVSTITGSSVCFCFSLHVHSVDFIHWMA